VFMLVYGSGCALAGLAGVIGGITFITEPAMAAVVGSIIFVVVVVGGMGSLAGAFAASILIGLLQTLPLPSTRLAASGRPRRCGRCCASRWRRPRPSCRICCWC